MSFRKLQVKEEVTMSIKMNYKTCRMQQKLCFKRNKSFKSQIREIKGLKVVI